MIMALYFSLPVFVQSLTLLMKDYLFKYLTSYSKCDRSPFIFLVFTTDLLFCILICLLQHLSAIKNLINLSSQSSVKIDDVIIPVL